jgi:hypothetical protein
MSNTLSVILILVTGAFAVFQDFTIRKVRNWLMLSVLTVYVALLISGLLTIDPWPYKTVLLNIFIGIVCSAAMWQFEIWPAGDAKLFILFTILLPLDYYLNGPTKYFPAVALLMNIFFLGILFLCLKVLVRLGMYFFSLSKNGVLRKTIHSGIATALKGLPAFMDTMVFIVLTFLVARLVGDYVIGYGVNIFKSLATFQFLFIFLFYRRLVTYLRSKLVVTTCLSLLVGLSLLKLALLNFNFPVLYAYMFTIFKMSLYSIVAIQVLIIAFDIYIKITQIFEITPDQLEPWIIIDRESISEILKEHNVKIKFTADGVEPEDVDILKEILPAGHKIKVHKTFPFAPFIVGGVLLTMLLKMSFIHMITLLLR